MFTYQNSETNVGGIVQTSTYVILNQYIFKYNQKNILVSAFVGNIS